MKIYVIALSAHLFFLQMLLMSADFPTDDQPLKLAFQREMISLRSGSDQKRTAHRDSIVRSLLWNDVMGSDNDVSDNQSVVHVQQKFYKDLLENFLLNCSRTQIQREEQYTIKQFGNMLCMKYSYAYDIHFVDGYLGVNPRDILSARQPRTSYKLYVPPLCRYWRCGVPNNRETLHGALMFNLVDHISFRGIKRVIFHEKWKNINIRFFSGVSLITILGCVLNGVKHDHLPQDIVVRIFSALIPELGGGLVSQYLIGCVHSVRERSDQRATDNDIISYIYPRYSDLHSPIFSLAQTYACTALKKTVQDIRAGCCLPLLMVWRMVKAPFEGASECARINFYLDKSWRALKLCSNSDDYAAQCIYHGYMALIDQLPELALPNIEDVFYQLGGKGDLTPRRRRKLSNTMESVRRRLIEAVPTPIYDSCNRPL